ncbi:CsgG/HfaB family protein [Emticicia sp. TH156]|uniref:CsgG/HfaB family protein n=1 Tax=Emticicia sp. TH156 TaxID=2067454 RepID=UPI000C785216|nr:CsgG/HfaB family protein [Emticicia sp. TH156]PLK42441.1 hypothetical protein C0V77_20720 [Emticicia sp. TH156]
MKLILFIFLFLISLTKVSAKAELNQEKPTIAILPFQFNSDVSLADAKAIAQKVESAFVNSKRFTVIERTNFEQIFKELDSQKSEIYLNSSKLAKQGQLIGASQIVVGNISAVSNEGTTFNIKIVDVSTGETIGSKDISDFSKRKNVNLLSAGLDLATKGKGGKLTDKSTTDAIGGALLNIDKEIQDFINETFALTYQIVEISKNKGDEAVELIILGGVGDGLKSSLNLEIVHETLKLVGNKPYKLKAAIGKIKVDKVQGDFTLCKVTSGGKEIKNQFAPGNKVYASTIINK